MGLGNWVGAVLLSIGFSGSVFAHEDIEIQIARVTQQIEKEPERAALYLRRGELHRIHENWTAAREDYEKALARDAGLTVVHLASARVWNATGDARRALDSADRFLADRPGQPEGLIERARALAKLGRRMDAARDFTRALEQIAEPQPEIYLERAEALRAEGAGHLDAALRGIDEGLRKLGPAVQLQLKALDLELEAGRTDAALARLDEISRKGDRRDSWLIRRGEILRAAGRLREAREALAAALAAIEALPAARRQTKFTRDLEQRARAAMEAMQHEKP